MKKLRPTDTIFLAYLVAEIFAILIGMPERWLTYLAVHCAMIVGITTLALSSDRPWRLFLRDWYPILAIFMIFAQLGPIVFAAHTTTYDELLLKWDHALFGDHAGVFFDRWASPLFTEILRGCWLSYFVLPLIVGIQLWNRTSKHAFDEYVLALIMGWLLSFAGYYVVPAKGPGYFPDTIKAPVSVVSDGPTQSIAQTLFSLEGEMPDVFPSGHAIISLLLIWQAFRHRTRGRYLLVPIVGGLLMATVYLRYHYGVDVLAGALIALFVTLIAPRWAACRTVVR